MSLRLHAATATFPCARVRFGSRVLLALIFVSTPWQQAFAGCRAGFVERAADNADKVCVTPQSRARVQAENARTAMLWGAGSFGARTCALGNVWREAFAGDLICVPAQVRALVKHENETAAEREAP